MAEIAAVFHWSKADLEALTLPELIYWRERAVHVWGQMWSNGKGAS